MTKEKTRALKDTTTSMLTSIRHHLCNKITLYSILLIFILVAGNYSNIVQYANAVTVTVINSTHASLAGGTYVPANDSWYIVSSNNNTLIRVVDNTTTVIQVASLVSATTNCVDAINVKFIESASTSYVGIVCRDATSTHFEVRRTDTGERVDFEGVHSLNTFPIVEWITSKKLFLLNMGGGANTTYMYNINNINTTSPMYQSSFNFGAQCNTPQDAVILETRNEMWIACTSPTADSNIVIIDLTTMTIAQTLNVQAGGTSAGIDYNSVTDRVAVLDFTNNDIFIYNPTTRTSVQAGLNICTNPVDAQYNTNTNQVFVVCKGNNSVYLYDVASNTVVATFPVSAFDATAPFTVHNYPQFFWREDQRAGMLTHAFLDAGHGNTVKFVTRIEDTSASSGAIGGTVCVDINPLPDFTTLQCFTDTNNDGIPDQQPDTPRTPFNATFSGYVIGCQTGVIDCNNPNPKTNGVGYLYTLFLLIGSIGLIGYLVTWKMTDVSVMIWMLDAIIVTGISFLLNWTDGLLFFASIIAICALGAFKARELFG